MYVRTCILYNELFEFFTVGVAYEIRSDLYFWIIEGGQGPLYVYNIRNETVDIQQPQLDRPLSLATDWVSRKLFWVQDGDTVSIYMYMQQY